MFASWPFTLFEMLVLLMLFVMTCTMMTIANCLIHLSGNLTKNLAWGLNQGIHNLMRIDEYLGHIKAQYDDDREMERLRRKGIL
jgi:hypothetical protein